MQDCKFYDIPGLLNEVETLRNKQLHNSPSEFSSSNYLLLESFNRGQKIEVSGRKRTINKLFNLSNCSEDAERPGFTDVSEVSEDSMNSESNSLQYYQNYPLNEAVKSPLTSAQAVDVVLTNKNFKLFKISNNSSIDNQPITSYHFISQ